MPLSQEWSLRNRGETKNLKVNTPHMRFKDLPLPLHNELPIPAFMGIGRGFSTMAPPVKRIILSTLKDKSASAIYIDSFGDGPMNNYSNCILAGIV